VKTSSPVWRPTSCASQEPCPSGESPAAGGRPRFVASSTAILLVVLAIGASFRFSDLGFVRHSHDDSYPSYDALRLLDAHELILTGQPSSTFLDNPPLMGYLQAIPLLFWRSPWAVYIFIIALNASATWFVYRAAQQLLGDTVGLVSAFLFAVNPWVVYFSRTTWVQALMPFFTALIAWGLWPTMATERRSPSRVFIACLVVTAMIQTYVQAWGVLAQIGLLIILFRRKIPRRTFQAGFLIFLVAMIPYGVGLSRRWETNYAKLQGFSSEHELGLTRAGLGHAVRLVTGRNFEDVWARGETVEYYFLERVSPLANCLLSVALITGLVRAAIGLWKRGREQRTAVVLLVWFALPILLMSVSAHPVHVHYLLLSCPAGHILAAWGLSPLLRRTKLRWVALPMLLALAIVFGLNLHQASEKIADRPTGPGFDNWALTAGAQLGTAIRDLSQSQEGSYPRRIYAEGREASLSSMSGTYVTTLRGLDFPNYVVLPSEEPLLYVLTDIVPEPEALGPLQESFPGRDMLFTDGPRVSFLRVLPYSREAALALPDVAVDWPSEAGLSLLGYSLDTTVQPGQSARCTTYWRVEELLPERGEWYIGAFYHLLDQSGRLVANVTGQSQWARRWHLGDTYVERISIPVPADLPPGEYRFESGVFDCIHMRNYSLHSPGGPVYAISIPVTVEKVE